MRLVSAIRPVRRGASALSESHSKLPTDSTTTKAIARRCASSNSGFSRPPKVRQILDNASFVGVHFGDRQRGRRWGSLNSLHQSRWMLNCPAPVPGVIVGNRRFTWDNLPRLIHLD